MIKKNNIPAFSVIVVFVMFMIIGISLTPLLNIQLNPSTALPRTTVSFQWHDVSARVIEQEVTSKLEGGLAQMKGVRNISSVSRRGSGEVTIEFKKGLDPDALRFEIAMIIRQLFPGLPEGVSYPNIAMRQTDRKDKDPLMSYTLNANASPLYIQQYAENNIKPVLALMKGVNNVEVYGGNLFEWEIVFDSKALMALGVDAATVASAINNYFRSDILGMGQLGEPSDGQSRTLRVQLEHDRPETLIWNDIPIVQTGGRIIRLGDIARAEYKETLPKSYFRINGLNTVNLVLFPERGVNNLRLAKQVKEEMEQIRQKLPPGYSILLANDSTVFIKEELEKIGLRTLFSLLILMLFVLIVSRKWRYLFLISVSIAANLIIACIFYYFLKVEMHLYSLAGITVSFGMLIDNSIIMIDHLRYRGNRKVFLAILAATLTTIGALSVIFFLKEQQRVNLVDFSLVVMINLSVSMVVALFFIPALFEKFPLKTSKGKRSVRRKRRLVKFNRFYMNVVRFNKRIAAVWTVIFILGFGIPVHWLPEKMEGDKPFAAWYNKTMESTSFNQNIKPILEKVLGGSLRLFTENVFERNFYSEPEQTRLYVRGSMPEGCTVQHLNEAVMKMENYLSRFDEIDLFQTSIYNAQSASISITFKKEFEFSGFPYVLKEELISKAIGLGAIDWGVYGVGRGFSNALSTGFKNSSINLEGYNYDQLYRIAQELCDSLSRNPRVNGLEINAPGGWGRSQSLHEFFLGFDPYHFSLYEVTLPQFYGFLRNKLYRTSLTPVFLDGERQLVSLISSEVGQFNVWYLKNTPVELGNKQLKMEGLGSVEKRKTGNSIHKNNQQYQLLVEYDFVGPDQLSQRVREQHIKSFSERLPLGYKIYKRSWGWNQKEKKQYYLILLVIVIIFFVCSVLLESLSQPLAIISLIPFSFIGVFLTFYLFDFNFDQGGFASFILLCGIVVNAGLYILNDYNQLLKEKQSAGCLRMYINAFNYKIIPIMLTVVSTVLGLVPFVVGGQKEVFWFSFAVGTIGGLIFSILGIFIYLPVFLRLGGKNKRTIN